MIRALQLNELKTIIQAGKADRFYDWPEWTSLADTVRRLDNYECQHCKARGRYRRGKIVHHVNHLKARPDLALSIYNPDTGERQLVTLCRDCHRLEHPEYMKQCAPASKPLTAERWD